MKPLPEPPASGGRCGAQSPASFARCCSSLDERVRGLVLARERLLVRVDVLLHEGAHLLAPFGDAVRDDNGRHVQR